jgi:hypothetical protein
MSTPEPDDRLSRLEDALTRLAALTVEVGEATARNTADIAELSADIRRLFDGMSDHLRDHPST